MNVLQLDTPVKARWHRSLELQSITFENRSLALRVLEDCEDREDSSGKNWLIRFNTIQGLKMTTHESALGILYEINEEGAFFEFKAEQMALFSGFGYSTLYGEVASFCGLLL